MKPLLCVPICHKINPDMIIIGGETLLETDFQKFSYETQQQENSPVSSVGN